MMGARAALANLNIRNKWTRRKGIFIPASGFFHVEGSLLEEYSCFWPLTYLIAEFREDE